MSVKEYLREALPSLTEHDVKMIEAGTLVHRASYMTRLEHGAVEGGAVALAALHFGSVECQGAIRIMSALNLKALTNGELVFLGECFKAGYVEAESKIIGSN